METLQIYKTRKQELIEKTIEILPKALFGDIANRTFYFKIDESTNELTVDYYYYAAQIQLDDNCFYTIKDYQTPSLEDLGYESYDEVDFFLTGYFQQIENSIDEKIFNLECR